ncbi:MAG: class I SAM-dependent methyltransferase [Hyphomicrobiales bacterium]
MQSLLNELRPAPGDCDYLIASGSRALVGRKTPEGWPFELSVTVRRRPAHLNLRATEKAAELTIEALGDNPALAPIDLSLFVRACIRRWEGNGCSLIWSGNLRLDPNDPLDARTRPLRDRVFLEANYADLRPSTQSSVSEVYRYPLDVPWLYDPLDYEVMIPILNKPGIRRILDLGCGSGRNAVPLENAGYEVHGIDSAPESIEICRRFVRAPERFREASADSLPFTGSHFDAVLDVGCLHMLPDRVSRATVLAEVKRVLKPGGFLCGRALTPREPDWLSAQPFQSEAAGFTPAQIVEETDGLFEPRILGRTDQLIYYQLLKIV